MQAGRRRGRLGLAVIVAITSLCVAAPAAGAEDLVTASDEFPLVCFGDMVVDDAHGHIFLTGRDIPGVGSESPRYSDVVVVRGLDGRAQAVVKNLPGAVGLALDSAHARLYVALSRGDAVVAINTVTLTIAARYATGTGSKPLWLAVAGNNVVFSGSTGLGIINFSLGTYSVATFDTGCANSPLRSARDDTNRLASLTSWGVLCTYVVSGGWLNASNSTLLDTSGDGAFAVTPDGSDILVGTETYRTADLSSAGTYRGYQEDPTDPGYVAELAFDDSGHLAIGRDAPYGSDIVITDASKVVQRLEVGTSFYALAFNADSTRIFFAYPGGDADTMRIGIVNHPLHPVSRLSITGTSSTSPEYGQQIQVQGQLLGGGKPVTNAQVAVSRHNADGTQTLADVTTGADGVFSIFDVPSHWGTNTYEVTYDGGQQFQPSSTSWSVQVRSPTQLTAAQQTGTALVIAGRLTGPEGGLPGRTLVITKTDATGAHGLPPVTTNLTGNYQVQDEDPLGGTTTYTVWFGGDSTHSSSSATVTIELPKSMPRLTLKTDRTAYAYGETATLSVVLGPTAENRSVSIRAQRPGGTSRLLYSGPVDGSGQIALTSTLYANTRFSAEFSGDDATAARTVTADVTTSAKLRTRHSGQYRTANGWALYHHATPPSLWVKVSPSKAGECVRLHIEQLSAGNWRGRSTSACIRLTVNSERSISLTDQTFGRRSSYRMRFTWPGDATNTRSTGSWQYLRFTR